MKFSTHPFIKTASGIFLAVCITCLSSAITTFAGQHDPEEGTVSITLASPVGHLVAENQAVSGAIDALTGAVHIEVAVDGFKFVTPDVPEYINTSTTRRFKAYYLETDKFPDAFFSGKITELHKVNFSKAGNYPVEISGVITMHGVTREMVWQAEIRVADQQVSLKTNFTAALRDFNVRVPEALQDVFFKTVDIGLDCRLKH